MTIRNLTSTADVLVLQKFGSEPEVFAAACAEAALEVAKVLLRDRLEVASDAIDGLLQSLLTKGNCQVEGHGQLWLRNCNLIAPELTKLHSSALWLAEENFSLPSNDRILIDQSAMVQDADGGVRVQAWLSVSMEEISAFSPAAVSESVLKKAAK